MTAETTTSDALRRFIDKSGLVSRLAVMPLLHAEMRAAESTFEPVLGALERDKPLLEYIRHAACSAYFGGREENCPLREAFSRMGIAEFYRVVGVAVIHTHLSNTPLTEFVSHADLVGRLTELIAAQCAPDLAVEGYFAGLCHDAAVPAMAEWVTDYQYFVDQAMSHDPSVIDMERECDGFTHCEAGAEIVRIMGFPSAMVTAVKYHHEPQRLLDLSGDDSRLLSLVVLAERVIAVWLGKSASIFQESLEHEVQQACWDALKLDASSFSGLIEEMLELCRLRWKHH